MSDRLPNGTKIAGHQLGDALGQGGFGITYRARNLKTGAEAAIKEFFPSEYATRDEDLNVVALPNNASFFEMGLQAFLAEANILRDLPNQPGLVRVRAAFRKHKTAYCVMDYIKGDPLDRMVHRLMQANGHVPEALIRHLAKSLCSALAAVHDAGLIHRDIKPANIMIRMDGQPILIDFGAARPLGRKTSLGSMFTRKYAALEQFPSELMRTSAPLMEGPESDIFAMSVMLYEMVSDSLPPAADERYKALMADGRDSYLPIRESLRRNRIRVEYSDKLLDAIDLGCSLMPEDRPRNARKFAATLGESLRAVAALKSSFANVSANLTGQAPRRQGDTSQRLDPRPGTRLGGVAMLLIIVVLALMAGVYGFLTKV